MKFFLKNIFKLLKPFIVSLRQLLLIKIRQKIGKTCTQHLRINELTGRLLRSQWGLRFVTPSPMSPWILSRMGISAETRDLSTNNLTGLAIKCGLRSLGTNAQSQGASGFMTEVDNCRNTINRRGKYKGGAKKREEVLTPVLLFPNPEHGKSGGPAWAKDLNEICFGYTASVLISFLIAFIGSLSYKI